MTNDQATAAEQTQAPRGMENPTPTPRSTAAPSLKFEHTPGPWKIARGKFNGMANAGAWGSIKTPDDWYVAEIWEIEGVLPGEANARLMAASPVMLKALKAALWLLADIQAEPGVVQNQIRAAIIEATDAKATGAQQS